MKKILEVKNLRKIFYKRENSSHISGPKQGGVSNRHQTAFTAVNDICFELFSGECLGLVGESGCGKSTVAKMLARLLEPDGGEIRLNGRDVSHIKGRACRKFYADVQMVFQEPRDSFDPRRTLGDGIMESMRNHGMSKPDARARMLELLRLVELEEKIAERYPHQVSGGQCQRAAIARALAIEPQLIICDEATSALDVTVQAQIVKLLKKLQRNTGLSMLFISHDLALVQELCDRVLVMYDGSLVEEGAPDEVIQNPKTEYTRLQVQSAL